jgi:NAD(P)-dependent dehydrogenase (short-subunit alcohol dehydrogenase family)
MVDDHLDFSGKVALVTGGSTFIGRAAALAFAKHGAKVVVGDINDAGADTVELLTRAGGEGLFMRTNVADVGEVQGLVERTVNAFGGLHCAFNNAGILPPTLPLAEQEVDVFDRVMTINVRGVYLCLKQELRHMVRSGGGAIVNTASIAGLIADPECPLMWRRNMR